MSAQPNPTTPAPDPKAGFATKVAMFRRNARSSEWADDEIADFESSFQTTSDVDMALDLFKSHGLPTEIKDKEKELVHNKLNAKVAKLGQVGTPPDKLDGSKSEKPAERMNSKARENLASMNILPGACPAFRFNAETREYEVL